MPFFDKNEHLEKGKRVKKRQDRFVEGHVILTNLFNRCEKIRKPE